MPLQDEFAQTIEVNLEPSGWREPQGAVMTLDHIVRRHLQGATGQEGAMTRSRPLRRGTTAGGSRAATAAGWGRHL